MFFQNKIVYLNSKINVLFIKKKSLRFKFLILHSNQSDLFILVFLYLSFLKKQAMFVKMIWFLVKNVLLMLVVCRLRAYNFCMTASTLDKLGRAGNVLEADENCDYEAHEMQTFYCYNNGTCELRIIILNQTHYKKHYVCDCAPVKKKQHLCQFISFYLQIFIPFQSI